MIDTPRGQLNNFNDMASIHLLNNFNDKASNHQQLFIDPTVMNSSNKLNLIM